jgi:hypothetical protein
MAERTLSGHPLVDDQLAETPRSVATSTDHQLAGGGTGFGPHSETWCLLVGVVLVEGVRPKGFEPLAF